MSRVQRHPYTDYKVDNLETSKTITSFQQAAKPNSNGSKANMLSANEIVLSLIFGMVLFVFKCKRRLWAWWKCRTFWKDRGIP